MHRWIAFAAFAILGNVQAATLVLDGDNLSGANGVIVKDTSYNVVFQSGSCDSLYDNCSAFDFDTLSDGRAAAQALIDQVFSEFNPCTGLNSCAFRIPLWLSNQSLFGEAIAVIFPPSRPSAPFVDQGVTGRLTFTTFARFTIRPLDADSDGVLDEVDNCPSTPNSDQADPDSDDIGDLCDPDVDGDSIEDAIDNCPLVANVDQLDVDGDLVGDVCDDLIDNDADGIANDLDNCPAVPNGDQSDNDGDLIGDACDSDDDNDGIDDIIDNCTLIANEDQADNDSDNIGDVCDSDDDNDAIEDYLDNCPLIANVGQNDNDGDAFGDACDQDDDNDTINDGLDNCPLSYNPDQLNTDGQGVGDACNNAFDLDDDNWENDWDNCPNTANNNQTDFDYDGIGDACDPDSDNDSVTDVADACLLTPAGELVGAAGCSIAQICPCDGPRQRNGDWKNHRKYVKCIARAARSFKRDGIVTKRKAKKLRRRAARSRCGR